MNKAYFGFIIGLCCIVTLAQNSFAQSLTDTNSIKTGKAFFALPLVFYTPETNWGFGAAGIFAFRFKNNRLDSRPSQIQLGFAYTLNQQFLAYLPYQLFLRNSRYTLYGELGWYWYSYGIGNNSILENREIYKVDYPRLRINALRRISTHLYTGLRYWMDDFDIYDLESDELLKNSKITGNSGGLLSGAGPMINFDSRNNIFYPIVAG